MLIETLFKRYYRFALKDNNSKKKKQALLTLNLIVYL